ncbi:hypothetical protein [Pseudooceanicola sp.]|uniref:hypothetical protein n=1 Tax=Pseudooceanicola sp. TaxID=1914328 RepID=UPI0035C6CBEA
MNDWRVILAWVMGSALVLAGPVLPLVSARGSAGDLLLVVVPPWRDAQDVIAAAGGRPVGPVRGILGHLAMSGGADFHARLGSAGAWLVLDGAAVSALCGWEVT